MYFDAVVVFVTSHSLLFRLAVAILWQHGSYSLSFQVIFHRFFIFGNLGQKVASKKKLLASEVCSTLKYKY